MKLKMSFGWLARPNKVGRSFRVDSIVCAVGPEVRAANSMETDN